MEMQRLTGQDVLDADLPGWRLVGRHLRTRVRAGTFVRGLEAVTAFAAAAEELDHHPDLDLRYRFVDVALRHHEANGITPSTSPSPGRSAGSPPTSTRRAGGCWPTSTATRCASAHGSFHRYIDPVAMTRLQKLFVRRMAGYVTNSVQRRGRVLLGREQYLEIGGLTLTLPPEHDLPFYVRRDPTYDHYAIDLVRDLTSDAAAPVVIDVGANVGDTAIAMLATRPDMRVVAVEGSPRFGAYLERNLGPLADRASWTIGFVGPVGTRARFEQHGSTGGFTGEQGDEVTDWISPATLIAEAPEHDYLVWKSDVDGFDIHLLVQHWDAIDGAADAMWFEYDPTRTLGDRADVDALIDLLAASGRHLMVYDNIGRKMFELPAAASPSVLRGLNDWLREQFLSHVVVPYLDLWAVRR